MEERKVPFTEKRVDESWKNHVYQEKGKSSAREHQSPLDFTAFVTSLGIQALVKMGELKPPDAEKVEPDLDQAQETIDLLLMLKEKTKRNLTAEEESLLGSLIADLQLKFVHHTRA